MFKLIHFLFSFPNMILLSRLTSPQLYLVLMVHFIIKWYLQLVSGFDEFINYLMGF